MTKRTVLTLSWICLIVAAGLAAIGLSWIAYPDTDWKFRSYQLIILWPACTFVFWLIMDCFCNLEPDVRQ